MNLIVTTFFNFPETLAPLLLRSPACNFHTELITLGNSIRSDDILLNNWTSFLYVRSSKWLCNSGAWQSHFSRGAWNLINWYWRVPTAGRPRIALHNSNCGCGVTAARCGAALLSADGSVQQVLQPCAENEFISVKMSRVWRRSYPDPAGPRPAGCSPSAGEETKRDSDEVEAARTMNPCFFLFCF